MNNISIACGPFIGDFSSEIIMFRPYVKWLCTVLKPQKIFISTHKNRKFLYPDNAIFLPIFEELTRNEFSQDRVIHKDINSRDYNIIMKKFKIDIQNYKDGVVFYYGLPYNKFAWVPEYKRIFQPLPNNSNKESKILFIPVDIETTTKLNIIYDNLIRLCPDMVCVGDMHTHLPEYNILLRDSMYFQNIYKNIVNYISSSKCVIVPSGVWTMICDIHNIPCFSWGKYTGPPINNRNIMILNHDEIRIENLILVIEKWLSGLNLLN